MLLLFYSIFVVFARLQLTRVLLLFAGDMAERRERLLKLTHDKKINKRLVRAPQATRMGPPTSLGGDASSGSSGSPDAEQPTELITRKRSRAENRSEVGEESVAARDFGLPPLF